MNLPTQYAWLAQEPGPLLLTTALRYYGMKEGAGSADNPIIMKWAHDFGITWYDHDSIAWCSLYLGEMAKEAGLIPPGPNYLLAASSWATWGNSVGTPKLADILVFNRPGGHHVGLYIGEDSDAFHVLGGNTGDAVAIARLAKNRLMAARRPSYDPMPENIRRITLSNTGTLSLNEA